MKQILGFLLLTLPCFCFAEAEQHYSDLFEAGNVHYKNGNYDSATSIYQQIQGAGYESAPLLFNLGNSYFKQGAFPEAILNYERALKRDPSNPDIQFNLSMANNQIVDKIEPLPGFFMSNWWKAIHRSFDLDYWALLCIAFSAMVALSIFLFKTSQEPSSKQSYFFGGILGIFLFVFCVIAANSQYTERYRNEHAIVFDSSVTLRSEPAENSSELFVLHDGTKVQVLRTEASWFYVAIADGNKGWILVSSLVKI